MVKVLIVDDDEEQRLLFRTLLEGPGHQLYFAVDGGVALKMFKEHAIDVVVTDLAMPNVNGLRLIKEIRKEDPSVSIIAISGVARDQLLLAEDYGAMAILTKPVAKDAFLEAMTEALKPRGKGRFGFDGRWHPAEE